MSTEKTVKVKKKPIRTWLQKLLANMKANKAKRKQKHADNKATKASNDTKMKGVNAVNDPTQKENILDRGKNLVDKAKGLAGKLGVGKDGKPLDAPAEETPSEEIAKVESIWFSWYMILLYVAILAAILYFAGVFK